MWLAGWAVRKEPAAASAMDLYVKALALEDAAGRRFVIVTADLIAISRDIAAAVAARIHSRYGLDRGSLLFAASHTHHGPEVRPDKVPFFSIPPDYAAKIPHYVASLEDKITATIESALNSLSPVTLQFAQTSADFAHNRRTPDGPVSHDVPVLQILRPDKNPLAILFGYACHNLVLPPLFYKYHGDYAGIAQRRIEEAFPGATALFLPGAGADQDPAPRGTVELAAQHGQTLTAAIVRTFAQPVHSIQGPLRAAYEEISLDFLPPPSLEGLKKDVQSPDPVVARKAKFLLTAREANTVFPSSYPCPVQLVGFGNGPLLVALGGEPVVDYVPRLRTELARPAAWVAGYCNDMFGYLPTQRIQAEGGYEGDRALLWSALPAQFTEATEDKIIAAVRRLAAGF